MGAFRLIANRTERRLALAKTKLAHDGERARRVGIRRRAARNRRSPVPWNAWRSCLLGAEGHEPGMKDNLRGLLKAVLVPVGIVLLVLLMVLFGTGS